MALGAQLVDYTVLIGSGRCVGTYLSDNVLRCQPPVDEPPVDVSSNNACAAQNFNSVLVSLRQVSQSSVIMYLPSLLSLAYCVILKRLFKSIVESL